jgi:hypothetical protein
METIEKMKLPITITKIKIGGKFISKSFIEQIPWGLFIYNNDDHIEQYGVSFNKESHEIMPTYFIDGTILGFVKRSILNLDLNPLDYTKKYNRLDGGYPKGYLSKYFFIIWYDNNHNLYKGYIDEWTATMIGIDLEQIYI